MPEKVIIKRTRSSQAVESREFLFSRQMVPAFQESWNGPDFLRNYRTRAWELYDKLPMPTNTDEAWRRTDIKSLNAGVFKRSESADSTIKSVQIPEELLEPLVDDRHGGQITIKPGEVQAQLDPLLAQNGVVFCDLVTAEREYPDLLEKIIGQIVRPDEGKFSALVAAMAQTGVLVYVPRYLVVEQPLHSVIWGPGINQAYLTHILVYIDDGASLTYVHEAASPTEAQGQTLHAGIVEIHVGDGANLRFVELQSWGEHVWNFSHERARVGRNGNLDWIFGAMGSHLTKNFSDLDLIGQGANGRMSGFYFTDGRQHLDHDTQQNHLAANTTSDLLFKGALKDTSRSVWQGMIYVAPGAQKTDGYQANRNLVLSEKARADSIPGLEILADDVRCTHGATVGKIDADQVFYLQSRGLPRDHAERLVVEGFFDPIMQRIPFERVRERFQQAILDKMS
jgi:Fe-S cluster assembly protein SufD